MFQRINFSDFVSAFHTHGRQDQFSYEAKRLLFDYLESIENITDEDIELDVIALCCEYQESSVDDIIESYSIDIDEDTGEDKSTQVLMYLEYHTSVVGKTADDTLLFAQF